MVDFPQPQPPQVFVNLGTNEMFDDDFIKHLVSGLKAIGILNVFIDKEEWWGRDLSHIFSCIEESTIALVIFSPCYQETEWCFDELVKINKQANEKKLLVIPVFYNVSKKDVRNLQREFGDRFAEIREKYVNYKYDPFRVQRWETSLASVSRMEPSLTWEGDSSCIPLAADIVREVKRELDKANGRHSKMAIREVFVSAFLTAFLFSLFTALWVFEDVKFFKTAKWLLGFPVTVVVLHRLYCVWISVLFCCKLVCCLLR